MSKPMTNLEMAQALRHGLFGDRGTDLRAAFGYAYDMIESIEGSGQVAAFTALHVVLNTISNVLKENEFPTTEGESE
jgi:hypothetical protein